MNRTPAALALLASATLLVGAGCGGSDGDGGTTVPSRDDAIAKAKEICLDGATKLSEISNDLETAAGPDGTVDDAKVSEQAGKAADVVEENLDRLADVEAPGPVANAIDAAVNAGRSATADLRGADITRLRAALKRPFGGASDALVKVGIDCAT